MASIRKHARGWRAEVYKKGKRASKVLPTKGEASKWALEKEAELDAEASGLAPPGSTVGDMLQRYADRVSINKRGAKWERDRIGKLQRDPVARVRLDDLQRHHWADWRDRSLTEPSAATGRPLSAESVRREWNLIRHACRLAQHEWGWLSKDVCARVTMPPPEKPRDRRISDDEAERIYLALGYDFGEQPRTVSSRVGAAFRWAMCTAMRAGEITGIRWDGVNGRVVTLTKSKSRPGAKVPLVGDEPLQIIEQLRPVTGSGGYLFDLTDDQRSSLWQRGMRRSGLADLHFHDTRAEALTRLARTVDVMTLARISGHRDLNLLQSTYYRETADEIAERLSK